MTLVQPSPQQQVHIRQVLNENPETRNRDLEIIKDWLKQQPHLPDTYDEHRLMTFLRGTNFRIEKCKRKIDMYFTMRTAIPEFFTNRDINRPELISLMNIAEAAILPGLTEDGLRISVARATTLDFETPDIADLFKIAFMAGDIRLGAEETGVAGDIYIADAAVASLKHFLKVSPVIVKKFLVCAQEAYPVKVKQVHIVNMSPFVEFLINWTKPFLKEKLRRRIYTHSSLESLHEYVPKDLLPEEFGGTAGKLQDIQNKWLQVMREYGPWFAAEEQIKADESKRIGQATNYDDLFGLDGTFKQLSID